jgi:4-hydroxy-tetrahydrodipicolinate reductase
MPVKDESETGGEGGLDVALVGYGKMGRQVEEVARLRGHRITARIDPAAGEPALREVSAESVAGAEVAIEFTEPGAVAGNVTALLEAGVRSIVVGTTGWLESLSELAERVEAAQAGLLYAYNFSLGVNLFYRMVDRAAELADAVPGYDLFVEEVHHASKKDRPSGTAMILADTILDRVHRKTTVVTRPAEGPALVEELRVTSIRAGHEPGTHRVVLDGYADTIELIHRSRNRRGFAEGAVLAAEWLHGQRGVFTFRDVLGAVL